MGLAAADGYEAWLVCALAMGLGTALVYPTLIAAIGDRTHPTWRASAVGVYRLWRDLGYAAAGLLVGIVADVFDDRAAIVTVGALTDSSGVVVARRMREAVPRE